MFAAMQDVKQNLRPEAKEHHAVPAATANAGSGWAVLQDSLVGVKGTGTRLKDWDMMSDISEEGSHLDDDRGDDSDDK